MKYIMIAATGVIVICYFLGLMAGWVSPERLTIPTYFVMAMPLWILLMWGIIICWACCKKWWFTLILCTIMIVTFEQWRKVITINNKIWTKNNNLQTTNNNQNTIKILTFNTHIFSSHKNNGFENIAQFIKESNADIVCLQEFGYYHRYGASKQEILKLFDSIYPYRHIWFKNQNKFGENGLATFSRYPIINKKKIEYKSNYNISIYSDIVINNDTIRIINNHLESNKFNQADHKIVEQLMDHDNSSQEIINAGKKLSDRLVTGAKYRTQQIGAVKSTIDNTKHKIIVVGDFNDVPLSYTYSEICNDLQDAYAQAGNWGYHWTYNKSAMLFAIDHILVDKKFEVINSKVHRDMKLSDHYPISCELQIK